MYNVKTRFGLGAGKCIVGRSAVKSRGDVREFYIVQRVVTL